jgi:hypothetical protein
MLVVLATAWWLDVCPANCSVARYSAVEPDAIVQLPTSDVFDVVPVAGDADASARGGRGGGL